jgi:hypothetical protein
MDAMTLKKVASLTYHDNMEESGTVMTRNDGQRAIVERGAVRWLTNDEMWSLMHPRQHETINYNGKSYSVVPCPFCAAGVFSVRPLGRIWMGMRYSEPTSFEIMHHCDPVMGQPSRPVIRVGRDLQSAIDAWNQRK